MAAVHELSPLLGAGAACRALALPRGAPAQHWSSARRTAFVGLLARRRPRPLPPLALDAQKRLAQLETLNSERSDDSAPAAVQATLLDQGRYLGSVRTIYRLLPTHDGCRERRNQLHPFGLRQAGVARHRGQPGLVVGHHQAQGAGQMDLLPPVRQSRHLQPARRGLVDRRASER